MAPLVLNGDVNGHTAAALLAPPLLPLADALVTVGPDSYPAHRAVLALHSPLFRAHALSRAGAEPTPLPGAAPPSPGSPLRVALTVPSLPLPRLHAGWLLVYDFLYEVPAPAAPAATVAAALEICDAYAFNDLADVLLPAAVAQVAPSNCVDLWLSARAATPGAKSAIVRDKCVEVMKLRFAEVSGWGALDTRAFARVLKLNDLGKGVLAEDAVFRAVCAWVAAREDEKGGPGTADHGDVDSVVKLVRFPTISRDAAAAVVAAPLVVRYPFTEKYVAQIARAPRRHITVETSPLFRPRRAKALTFADRVASFSRVEARMQTSARYFSNCLWHLVVGKRDGFVELYLGVLSEDAGAPVQVELDFTLYIAQMAIGVTTSHEEPPPMVRREVKRATFSKSGQRIGFPRIIPVEDVPDFARNDTLLIGASMRLRGCREHVEAIDDLVDHSVDSITC